MFFKMYLPWIILMFFVNDSTAYIFHLNGSDYARMPALFHLDPYEACLHEDHDSGVYCSVKFDLVSDGPSELYTMITEYSSKTEIHFNHTLLTYGICLTSTCKEFYTHNTTEDQKAILEACLNDTMWKKYKLKTRIREDYTCETLNKKKYYDASDIAVGTFLTVLLLIHLVGSLQDFYLEMTKCTKLGNKLLACFSIRRNWKKLTSSMGEGSELYSSSQFTAFHGMRAISSMLVIMVHSMLPFVTNSENPQDFEEGYNKWYYQIMANGPLVIQSYFVMSSFLLAYLMQVFEEKRQLTWTSIPKIILGRWLRLTPPNLIVLIITATLMRHFGSGPLWQSAVMSEVEDCKRDWWYHLLYLNNYVDNSHCLIQSWYIAADFQLFCLGVLVCVLTRGRWRKIVLGLMFIAGLIIPAVYTYMLDLNGNLMITPEMARNMFMTDPTFIHTYKRGHTNIATYVIGLSLGLLVYHWQKTGYKLHPLIRHRFVYWLSVPVGLAIILLGSVFFRDAPRDPVIIRAVYSAFIKPLWGFLAVYFIVGLVYRFEDTYRGVLEWSGWKVPSRVSYCAYLIHVSLIRVLTGTRTTTVHFSFMHLLEVVTSSIAITFIIAIPFHLLFEAPFLQIIKLSSSIKKDSHQTKDALNESNETQKDMIVNDDKTDRKTEIQMNVDCNSNLNRIPNRA